MRRKKYDDSKIDRGLVDSAVRAYAEVRNIDYEEAHKKLFTRPLSKTQRVKI
jgi:hypothetical protein